MGHGSQNAIARPRPAKLISFLWQTFDGDEKPASIGHPLWDGVRQHFADGQIHVQTVTNLAIEANPRVGRAVPCPPPGDEGGADILPHSCGGQGTARPTFTGPTLTDAFHSIPPNGERGKLGGGPIMVAGQIIGQRAGGVEMSGLEAMMTSGFFSVARKSAGGLTTRIALFFPARIRIQRHFVVPGGVHVRIPPHHLILAQSIFGVLGGVTIIIPLVPNGQSDGQAGTKAQDQIGRQSRFPIQPALPQRAASPQSQQAKPDWHQWSEMPSQDPEMRGNTDSQQHHSRQRHGQGERANPLDRLQAQGLPDAAGHNNRRQ